MHSIRWTAVTLISLSTTAACAPSGGAAGPAAVAEDRLLADSLDPFIRRWVDEGYVPGLAVAVVRRGGPVYLRGFGVRDVQSRAPVTPSTVFYIASSTKSFTGTLAAVMAQRGQIDLDAPLSRYLPDLRMRAPLTADSITLRRLLTHTAGFENGPVTFRTAFSGDHDPATLLRLLGESTPRDRAYRYDNLGYIVAAMAMERVAGRPWQDLLRTDVFQPLGMAHTTARVSEAQAAGWPLASPHFTGPDGVERITIVKRDNTMHAAGGILTTAQDLARWLEAQLNGGRVDGRAALPEAVVRATHTPYAAFQQDFWRYRRSGYGLGWNVAAYEGERMLHHFGGYEGWQAHVSFLPERGIGIAVLANDNSPVGGMVPDVVATYAYDLLLGRPGLPARYAALRDSVAQRAQTARQRIREDRERRAARPPTPEERKPFFVGSYENPLMGAFGVELRDGRLFAVMGNLLAPLDPFTRPDALRVELGGSGQPVLFYFRDDRTPADSLRLGDNVFRRRAR